MRRTLTRLGLLGLLVGTPFALGSLVGSPMIPDFRGSDGLSGTFVPVEAVLRLVGLLAWALWAYLSFAVLLYASAVLAASRGERGQGALRAPSSLPRCSAAWLSSLLGAPSSPRRCPGMPLQSPAPPARPCSSKPATPV